MTTTKKPSEVLRDAREIMSKRGWVKGGLEDEGGRVCVLGAVLRAGGWQWGPFANASHALQLITKAEYGVDTVVYNDDPATTYEDIELLWKKAIYAAEEAEEGNVEDRLQVVDDFIEGNVE